MESIMLNFSPDQMATIIAATVAVVKALERPIGLLPEAWRSIAKIFSAGAVGSLFSILIGADPLGGIMLGLSGSGVITFASTFKSQPKTAPEAPQSVTEPIVGYPILEEANKTIEGTESETMTGDKTMKELLGE